MFFLCVSVWAHFWRIEMTQKRTSGFHFQCSDEQKAAARAIAAKHGMNLGAYLLKLLGLNGNVKK